MDGEKDVTAVFERNYPLTLTIDGDGSVDESLISGTDVELTAEPDSGWYFIEWEGDIEGDENPITISVDGETNVKAVFENTLSPPEFPWMKH